VDQYLAHADEVGVKTVHDEVVGFVVVGFADRFDGHCAGRCVQNLASFQLTRSDPAFSRHPKGMTAG